MKTQRRSIEAWLTRHPSRLRDLGQELRALGQLFGNQHTEGGMLTLDQDACEGLGKLLNRAGRLLLKLARETDETLDRKCR